MEFVVQSDAPWIDVRGCSVLHKAFCDFELWESATELPFGSWVVTYLSKTL
jgi:hypothetical protein